MKKSLSLLVLALVVCSMISCALAASGQGIVEIHRKDPNKASAYAWINNGITGPGCYKYIDNYFFLNGKIEAYSTKDWAFWPDFITTETSDVTLSSGDEYYGKAFFGMGPIYQVCDDEWTSSDPILGGTYTFTSTTSALQATASRIAQNYQLQTDYLEYSSTIDLNSEVGERLSLSEEGISPAEFVRSFECKVERVLLSTLTVGDYVPIYWFDRASKRVYIGLQMADGTQKLCWVNWKSDKNGNIQWSKIHKVEKTK